MACLYRSCDVFVSPYRGEGFSLPALEAMACGLPVVVTKGGATDDFVDESTGWLVSAGKRSIGSVIDKYPLAGEAFVLEPDNNSLSAILKDIYSRPSVILTKGLKASLSARTQWTWKKATIKMFSRLDALYGTRLAASAVERLCNGADDAAILLGRAELAFEESDYHSASQYFNLALETEELPEKYIIHVLHRLAQIQINTGEIVQARGQLSEIENILGHHPDTGYLKARVHRLDSEWTEALECLTSVYESWQDSRFDSTLALGLDDLLCDTADAMMAFEDSLSAMTLYSEALKLNNSNAKACLGSAKCFLSAGATDEARNMLGWAVSLDPDLIEASDMLQTLDR
jgi:tetratricopeptide (TPR) repeat protein